MNGSPKIDPARLTPAQLAAMLSRSGEQQYTEADIEADIKAGAPTNDDGTDTYPRQCVAPQDDGGLCDSNDDCYNGNCDFDGIEGNASVGICVAF